LDDGEKTPKTEFESEFIAFSSFSFQNARTDSQGPIIFKY